MGISGGTNSNDDGGSSNAGINASISRGNSRWVEEQTSLTGGIVDIYVENKTSLIGGVIASDTGYLTLDTGSFEYSNIKDKNRSTNFGGGINAGSSSEGSTGSVNATYGFTDIRQTGFATFRGGQAETLWNRFSDTANTTSNTSYNSFWNTNHAGSSVLQTGTVRANSLDMNYVVARDGEGAINNVREHYGNLSFFKTKTELGYYKDGKEALYEVKKGDNTTAMVERRAIPDNGTVDDIKYGVYKYDDSKLESDKHFTYDFSKPAITGDNKYTEGAKVYTNEVFNTLNEVSNDAEIAGVGKFHFTVDNSRYHFSNMDFNDQTHFDYTFAGVANNLGVDFNNNANKPAVTNPGDVTRDKNNC